VANVRFCKDGEMKKNAEEYPKKAGNCHFLCLETKNRENEIDYSE
jgi:hypothetical protein